MERLQLLEKVLHAAQRVLEAREYEMLTHHEWDALQAAIAEAKTEVTTQTEKTPVRIVFEDGLMLVWDHDGNGVDCHELGTAIAIEAFAAVAKHQAERQIDHWAKQYQFDVEDVKRRLLDYVREL